MVFPGDITPPSRSARGPEQGVDANGASGVQAEKPAPKTDFFTEDFRNSAEQRQWNRRRFWSGRWESDPTQYAAKRLIPLVDRSGLASNSVQFQFQRYFFDSLTVGISYNVPIDFQSCSGIGVTELPLHDLGRCSRIEQ
jgi:hypothetical protein